MSMIPESYKEWHHFITVHCGIPLTSAYIEERLKALRDSRDANTEQFRKAYGQQQLENTIRWFEQARAEVKPS